MRFQIIGPEGQTFELSDVDYFRSEYQPKGYRIDPNPPAGYDVPDVDVPAPREMTRADLNDFAAKAGVADPESLPNKAAVLESIEQAQHPQTETTEEPPQELPVEPPTEPSEGEEHTP